MKAAVIKRYGARLILEARPLPKPQAGEVLLQMLYSPVNPSDYYFLKGVYGDRKPLPVVGGFEGRRAKTRGWKSPGLRRPWLTHSAARPARLRRPTLKPGPVFGRRRLLEYARGREERKLGGLRDGRRAEREAADPCQHARQSSDSLWPAKSLRR
jgi:hypothetical protein